MVFNIFTSIKKDKIHPEFLYEKFLEFQGELAAFSNEESF